jgi:lipopolysaccharide heptosyltransferase II
MISRDDASRVIFVNPFGIGDVLFTTPAVRAFKEQFPESFIGYWCNERVAEALKSNPHIDKVFSLSRGDIKKLPWLEGLSRSLSLKRELKKEGFKVAIDFSLDDYYSKIAKSIGIGKRVGFKYKDRGRFLTDKVDIEDYSNKHVVEHYLDLLKFFQIQPKAKNLELFVSEEASQKAKKTLAACGIGEFDLVIGIAAGAGASWGKDASIKHWPPPKFARVADKIIDTYKAKVVLLGDSAEQPISQTISGLMRNKPVDLTGKTTLEEFAAIIGRLRLLVTNDGGPLHMAVASGVKTVSIFGPVDESVYGPYPPSDDHIVVTHEVQCRPCYQKFRLPECMREKVCIKAVSAEDVYQSVRRLLG